jgi:hypothetical protein
MTVSTPPRRLCYSLFATVTIGCAFTPSYYLEAQLPPEQWAVIRSVSIKQGYQRVSISAIDGREVEVVVGSIRLAPGPHDLRLFVSSSGLTILFGEVEFRLDARAQHTYEIGGTIEHGIARVWIMNAETRQVVAQATQKIATTGGY